MRNASTAPVSVPMAALTWLLLAVLWWGAWDHRPLARPDEGRYGEIAREMAHSGDWITPRLNGIKYFEKPPLQYWATAVAYQTLGEDERSARLWTTLCGFLTLILTACLARQVGLGPAGGLVAASVLAGSLYPALLGHINTLDTGVAAFLTATLSCFLQAQRSPASRRWMLLAGACAGLAMLSKGLIGLVLPGLGLMLYTLVNRDLSGWRRLHPGLALLACLLVAGPWFVLVSWRNPEFPHFFFIHEHFERFTSTVHRRVEPAWYFLPLLLGGLLPWTLLLPGALRAGWQSPPRNGEGFRSGRFLLMYAIGVVAFFSASGSKLPGYIAPAFPALAVLLAQAALAGPQPPLRRLTFGGIGLGLLLTVAGLLLQPNGLDRMLGIPLDLDPDMVVPYAALAPWLMLGGAAQLAASALVPLLAQRQRLLALVCLGLAGLLTAGSGLHGASAMAGFNSSLPWLQASHLQGTALATALPAGSRLFSVGTYDQTLDFYLGRTVILVDFLDELEFGLQQEPERALATEAAFRATWGTQPHDHALLEPGRFAALQAAGLPMRVVARDARHVLVSAP